MTLWRPLLDVRHSGLPRPQGSLRALVSASTGRAFVKYSDSTVDHRNRLVATLRREWDAEPFAEAVAIDVHFAFERPLSHFRSGRFSDQMKPSAPRDHIKPADLDKLVRLVGDALVIAEVIADDSQIIKIRAAKEWTENRGHTKIGVFATPGWSENRAP
jgi:Holliday junction resolvase RusA-like endonuclease